MNSYKLIAPIIVALIVTVFFVGCVTVSVSANPDPYVIPVDGQPHTFTGAQLDYNNVYSNIWGHYDYTPFVTFAGGAIYFDYNSQTIDQYWNLVALVGMNFTLDPGQYTPAQVQSAPVTVAVQGTWSSDGSSTGSTHTLSTQIRSGNVFYDPSGPVLGAGGPESWSVGGPFAFTFTGLTGATLSSPLAVSFGDRATGMGYGQTVDTAHETFIIESITITIQKPQVSNQPPIANAGPDQTVTVNTKATLDGTASSDPDNNVPLTYAWTIASAPAGSTAQLSSTTADKPTFTPDKAGDYVFALNVTDNLGLQSTTFDTVKITANAPTGNRAPDVSHATPSVSCLWPPDYQLVKETIKGVTDPDRDKVTIRITKITSDEKTATWPGCGGTKYSPDAFIIKKAGMDDTAQLRAERNVNGNGRVYVISFTATDIHGAAAQGTVKVVVGHDWRTPCKAIDDGQKYDATVKN